MTAVDGYDYEQPVEAMRTTVEELLQERPPRTRKQFVCYEVSQESHNNTARTIERIVFESRFGNTARDMERIYGPYESGSRFFLVVDQGSREPAAATRLMDTSKVGAMTLNSLPPEKIDSSASKLLTELGVSDSSPAWDWGTLAVLPEYRRGGRGISMLLIRAGFLSACRNDVKHIFVILDEPVFQTLNHYLGIPYKVLARFSFEGSELSVAVHGYVPSFLPKVRRKAFTPTGLLARKSLWPLAFGSNDRSISLMPGSDARMRDN